MEFKSCFLFSSILLLVAFQFAGAQIRLNEREAIELVLKNHPRLRAAAAEVNQASLLGSAPGEWAPTRIYQHTTADPDFGLFGSVSLGLSQDFPSGKIARANRAYYQRLEERAKAASRLTEVELIQQVREIYHHLSYLEARKSLLQQLDSVYTRLARTAALRYEKGEASLVERLTTEDKAGQIRLNYQTVSHEIEFDRIVLGHLLGLDAPVEPLVEPLHEGRFTLSDTALLQRAAWKRVFDTDIELADAERQRHEAALSPRFSSSLFMQYLGNARVFPGWEVGIQIPLARKNQQARIEAARTGVAWAQANRDAAMQEHLHTLAHLLHEQEKYLIAIEYYHDKGQAFANQILQSAELSYRLGEMDFADLALALEQATQIELNYLENLLGLNLTVIQLEAITTP